MSRQQNSKKRKTGEPVEEALEKIIEKSRASAEAYRKILVSLEARIKKSK